MTRIADARVAETFRAFPPAARARLLAFRAMIFDEAAMYFICTTGLVDRFRDLYPRSFRFGGNRALLFPLEGRIQEKALRHCIAMALTYHRR